MSATQRARPGVPLDLRSAVPSVPGIPAWGAVAVAAGLTFLGFAVDAVAGRDELTTIFSVLYFAGCLAAVVAVRYRGLFTAVVQPPLLLFVAVPLGQQFLSDSTGTGLKDLALTVGYPLVERFPLMLSTTVVVALIAGARVFLLQQDKGAQARSRRAPARRAGADSTGGDRRPPRRTTAAEPRRPRPSHEPVSAHPVPGYREPVRPDPARRDGGYREPVRRTVPRRDPAYSEAVAVDRDRAPREPVAREPIPARVRTPAVDVPAHPVPQVRYRDRHEPPVEH